jgi:hypothetical protein
MKRSFKKILPTVTIPLIFTSMSAFAGDFSVPSTAQAVQRSELISHAAYALENVVAPQQQRERQMSNLWVFPTHDADTVFARYALTSTEAASTTPSTTEHLALVKVRDDGSVDVQELTEGRRSAAHWSASIGNGHTSNSSAPKTADATAVNAANTTIAASAGVAASPHWTARIGTGRAIEGGASEAGESAPESAPVQGERLSKVADAHWSSKVGTGRASEANDAIAARTKSSSAAPVVSGANTAAAF